RGGKLQEGTSALWLRVGELAALVLPHHREEAFLHAVVEVRAAEDELAQPVDERLPVHEREPLPVAHEVRAEGAPRACYPPVRGELDEIPDLVLVEIVRR